ncbi:hypothetical protein P154DRAFT_150555 [Amniculicola lignicola CBS 123094]|uniref:Uncharacterized protein n=1 Tax=Amniculicola lignicola CBS 123094 TaxID=1392246 RepID=A0A6A5WMR6_9PLEO|nr:hypothetical protein P154DRAFT_150555 [Amniculicola lignicola CBS 123094]
MPDMENSKKAGTHTNLPLERNGSKAHNIAMREIIKDWGSIPESPPGCQSISYSRWSRFSASTGSSTPTEEMKASTLWAPRGTTPDFNPPVLERTYLGVENLDPALGQGPQQRGRAGQRRKFGSDSSWMTESSRGSSRSTSEAIAFKREMVKPASTTSLLTESIKPSPLGARRSASAIEILTKGMKNQRLSASMLPSAFDSDSEEEEGD